MGYYELSIDWNNDGDFSDAGENLSSRLLMPLSWSRGRDMASSLEGRSISGQLTAILNNESGDYSPFNAASPLYGNLLPGRKVRLRFGTGAGDLDTAWTGFLSAIEPIPHISGVRTARLKAIGPLGYLNRFEAALPMSTSTLTGTAIGNILDNVSWPAGDRTLDTGQTTMTRAWVDKMSTIDALRKIEDSESGFLLEGKDGKIIFEDRWHRLKSPHYTSQATFSDANGAALPYQGIVEEDPLPHIFNEFKAKVKVYTVGGLAVLWTCPETGASSPFLDIGEARIFWASYPNPDSATNAVGVDAWTTPVATTDYTANTQSGGGGVDKTADMAIAVVKLGNSMKITITNNATTAVYLTLLQARGTPITVSDPIEVSKEDSASQTAYGKRTFPSGAEFIPDSQEAQNWCGFNLGTYKSPIPMLKLTLEANRNAGLMAQLRARDISDRITITANNRAGLGFSRDFFLESENHTLDETLMHTCSYELSDALTFSAYWILGVSQLGTDTRLVY